MNTQRSLNTYQKLRMYYIYIYFFLIVYIIHIQCVQRMDVRVVV